MEKYLVSINDLPPAGKTFDLDNQDIWLEPIREFKIDCKIVKPLKTSIFVMPADEGCVVRGTLTGEVQLPCGRCTENATISLNSKYDEYEEIPQGSHKERPKGEGHIVFDRNAPMLNLAEVAWEELMLALPVNPLCSPHCKGLCPKCGVNLNQSECECSREAVDPRMAALRDVKIVKQ